MLQSQLKRKINLNEMAERKCQRINKFVNNLRLKGQFGVSRLVLLVSAEDSVGYLYSVVNKNVKRRGKLCSRLSRKGMSVFVSTWLYRTACSGDSDCLMCQECNTHIDVPTTRCT